MSGFDDHIVAYIDFLGFKQFNKESKDKRQEFATFLEQIKAMDSETVIESVDSRINFKMTSIFYSDSLVLAWPLNKTPIGIDETIISIELLDRVTAILVRALCFGMLIRGAVTIGEFYNEKGIFFGKALDEAVYLESEVAIYPRIILSRSIFNRNLIFTSQDLQFDCQKFWLKDFDGVNYLNYFQCCAFRKSFWSCVSNPVNNGHILNQKIKEWFAIANENIKKHLKFSDDKVLQKWHWFANYFNNLMIDLSKNASWVGIKL